MATAPTDLGQEYLDALSKAGYRYPYRMKDDPGGKRILDAEPAVQIRFVLLAIAWMREPAHYSLLYPKGQVLTAVSTVLNRRLPFEHEQVVTILNAMAADSEIAWNIDGPMLKVLNTYLESQPRTEAFQAALLACIETLEDFAHGPDARRRVVQYKEIAGLDVTLPLIPGDAWADRALADLHARPPEQQAIWNALLQECAQSTGAAPSAPWQKTTQARVEQLGRDHVRACLLVWFPLFEKPRAEPLVTSTGNELHPLETEQGNIDILKGLAWLCAGFEDAELARALMALTVSAFRKIPGFGPRAIRVGNAGIWALSQQPGQHGLAQLAVLKTRITIGNAQKSIQRALQTAAKREGLTPDELEELLVPTYGLSAVGLRREPLGDSMAELRVQGSNAELVFVRADGKQVAAPPKALREQYGEAIKALRQDAAAIKQMIGAQRDRIEQVYLQQRRWTFAHWCERYRDHPLLGTLVRRLIWRVEQDGRAYDGIWHEGQFVGSDGTAAPAFQPDAQVHLWHPLDSPTEGVLAWREWLNRHQVQQPFKQAHREIYLLTDAERRTRVYSNRFAAHILRQHQFNALCNARGWKNPLRLMVDDAYPPATRLLAPWSLRAEYWVEGIGNTYGADTTESGTYTYIVTDQVRFYPITSRQVNAHASGGGYETPWAQRDGLPEPVPLEQVPPLVFSEIMRDVDLFVGVASVGNNPTWIEGSQRTEPDRTYWRNYSFGELSETAKTRHAVLAQLLPRLAIAPRCTLTERFLVVRGDIRSYKIHLGSTNILMEPNDQYLCIVPSSGKAGLQSKETHFVPFEGDQTLAVILSKALMLANDTAISDPTITRQLR